MWPILKIWSRSARELGGLSALVAELRHRAGLGVVDVVAMHHPSTGVSASNTTGTVCPRTTIAVSQGTPVWSDANRCTGCHSVVVLKSSSRTRWPAQAVQLVMAPTVGAPVEAIIAPVSANGESFLPAVSATNGKTRRHA